MSEASRPSWEKFRRSLRAEWACGQRVLHPAVLGGEIRRRLAAAAAALQEAVRREPGPKRKRFLF